MSPTRNLELPPQKRSEKAEQPMSHASGRAVLSCSPMKDTVASRKMMDDGEAQALPVFPGIDKMESDVWN